MPFPLAHPAAILPLRRLCPRWFSFPALVIGSICPDLGYCSGGLGLGKVSHRFLEGSFGICLPAGLLLVYVFFGVRAALVQRLPLRLRLIFEPLCFRPVGSPFVVVVSVLIGTWTHLFLDSLTHVDGWLVEHLTILQGDFITWGCRLRVYDLLYSFCTVAGVTWLALAYQNWLEQVAETRKWIVPGFKWGTAALLAGFTLLLSVANHSSSSGGALAEIILLSGVLVVLFIAVTGWALYPGPAGKAVLPRQQNAGTPGV